MAFIVQKFILILFLTIPLGNTSCPRGFFSLNGKECYPLMTCHDIEELHLGELIGYGAVKQVYKATWNSIEVAVVLNNNPKYLKDFHHGLNILLQLNPSKYISLLLGYCRKNNIYVTKYYKLGPLSQFHNQLPENYHQNLKLRFNLCLNYIEIIDFLHSSQDMPLVMCDTNTLNKTLEQYLLQDVDRIILNDVDALTEVHPEGIICGSKEIVGDFVAPEQLWPFKTIFNYTMMPKYDEKSDIYKIPEVCQYILGDSREAVKMKYHLFKINRSCHQIASLRPNASYILSVYKSIYQIYFSEKDEL